MDLTTIDHASLLRFIREATADAHDSKIPLDEPAPSFADYVAAAPQSTPAFDVNLSPSASKENTMDRLIAASIQAGAQFGVETYGWRGTPSIAKARSDSKSLKIFPIHS